VGYDRGLDAGTHHGDAALNLTDLGLGALAALIIALVALRVGALTRSGAFAAFVVGALTFGAGSIGTALLLLAFFISSTLLSRAGKARKRALLDIGKGGARDAAQVLANGGVATACIVVWIFVDHGNAGSLWFIAFAGAYAAATADTWGTEIGTLADEPPRSIITGKPLATGLSGGVSPAGTSAEFAGAVLIAVLTPLALALALPAGNATIQFPFSPELVWLGPRSPAATFALITILPVLVGGFGGAWVDSLLGATVQDRRWCAACARECETNPHACGAATERRRGLAWMSNDAVNLAATLAGALIAVLVALVTHLALHV
jgi:uncharacterized protein (TIGR00297 family)